MRPIMPMRHQVAHPLNEAGRALQGALCEGRQAALTPERLSEKPPGDEKEAVARKAIRVKVA